MRTLLGVVLAVGAGAWAAGAAEKKGTVIEIDGMKSTTPASWVKVKPGSKMRFAEFRLPKVKDDKIDAEVGLFKNAGGSLRDNIKRWKAAFRAPEGKDIDDVTKVTEMKIGGKKATMVDVRGTFQPPPFTPKFGGKKWPNFRRIAVQLDGDDLYHIILTGPADTVEHYKKGFDEWLKGFKKD
jgi:hypothetical protein